MTKKKNILVFSLFTLTFVAAAAAAILDIFSQSSFWKKTTKKTKKTIQLKEEEEKPNPRGSTTSTLLPPPGPVPVPVPGPDRISELPKEILVHILGFLEMDEFLIGTSLVSTKWRNLWKSVSILNFPESVVVDNGGGDIRNNVEKYHNFVDHVLRLRDSQASKVQIFRYDCYDSRPRREGGGGGGGYDDYLERLHNFIASAAVDQGAQEIHIMGFHLDDSDIHFNPSIFNSGLLRVFNFDVFVRNLGFRIHFPRSMCCATHLTHLSLNGIVLPEGDDDAAELHLVCPLLETFHMNFCYNKHLKVLDISAPRLNTLSICNIGMRNADFDNLGGCRIEIRTPNLTSLKYVGCVYVDCFTENLPRIADATLNFSMETGMMEQTTSFAIKLLKGLSSAESLTLGRFEVFSQDTLNVLLTPFTSLRILELASRYKITRSSIHWMVHILNICKSVEKFIWHLMFVEVEGDEDLMLPQCRLSHLKHVHIKNLCGHENGIEFVKFLVKSSVVLEDIIINTAEDSLKVSIEENLKHFISREEPSFRRQSIKLEIL